MFGIIVFAAWFNVKVGVKAVSKIIKKKYNRFAKTQLEGLLIPIEKYITGNEKIQIKNILESFMCLTYL